MANINDITTVNWQMSLSAPGLVVEGVEDVKQCIDVVLRTRKGSDPLRPEFGCGIFDYIDAPINKAIPNMKKEILEAIALFETRIEIVSITHEILNDE